MNVFEKGASPLEYPGSDDRKTIMKVVLLSFLLTAFAIAGSSQVLPASAVKYLNSNYPGWKLHPLPPGSGCSGEFRKAVVSGDFDGNRKLDYVARITQKRSGYLIALMSRGNAYTSEILERGSSSDIRYVGLSVSRKGSKYPLGDPYEGDYRMGRLPNDAPLIGPCESHAYYRIYRNGRFQ